MPARSYRSDPTEDPDAPPSWRSSSARPIAPRTPRERAAHRVAELLRAHGLTNLEHLGLAIDRLLEGRSVATEDGIIDAVRSARERLDRWLPSRIGEADARAASPERVRALLARFPEVLLDDDVDPGWLRDELGIRRALPPARLPAQPLGVSTPRWLLGLVPPVVLSALAVAWVSPHVARHGWTVSEVALLALLAVLTGLNGVALTLAALGLVTRAIRRPTTRATRAPRTRTAVVIAIYEEESERVFSGVASMRASLGVAGGAGFELFVLSDTQRAEVAAAEERAVRRLRAGQPASPIPLHYRRRPNNAGYKSGNLADFFMRWGEAYDYVVVLDADSLVEGETLIELARRMDADPGLGLLQLPIEPVRAVTPFARLLQLGGQLYGPLFTEGLAAWSGSSGNYFGHNAILRARAFIESGGLPELSGEPPFGGLILSHDFVEAALLRRAGWKVEMAADLGGSFEELPPTLDDFLARDRRWAQGNLQHLRVAAAEGLAPMSRLHLVLGALAYLGAPLWLSFLVLVAGIGDPFGARDLPLLYGAAGLLLAPKLLGLADALARRDRRRGFGGALRLTLAATLEILGSAALAPVLMVHHVVMLAQILIGEAVGWKPQRRRAGRGAPRARHALPPLVGIGLGVASALFLDEADREWSMALVAPLLLSPLIPIVGSSERVGRALQALGIFRVPTETDPPPVVDRLEELRALCLDDGISRFRDLVLDPVLNALHRRALAPDVEAEPRLIERALRIGPAALTAPERAALLASADAMSRLHQEAWTVWPIESWLVDRSSDLAPPEPIGAYAPKPAASAG